jgi:hypothetical protein
VTVGSGVAACALERFARLVTEGNNIRDVAVATNRDFFQIVTKGLRTR